MLNSQHICERQNSVSYKQGTYQWGKEEFEQSDRFLKEVYWAPSTRNSSKSTCKTKTCVCLCVQSYPIHCNPLDCSKPGPSVHGILQARILEWVFPHFLLQGTLKKAEHWTTDAFLMWCWRRLFESPLDSKEIKPVNPKGNQLWIFIGRTDAETEAPILWPSDLNRQLTRKDPDAGKDWRQEQKGTTEDAMVGWHHQLCGHEFEQTPKDTGGVTMTQTQLSDWTTTNVYS